MKHDATLAAPIADCFDYSPILQKRKPDCSLMQPTSSTKNENQNENSTPKKFD